MRRRIAMLLSAVLAASALAFVAQTQPAAADTDVCAGQGTADVPDGLFYPGFPNQAAGGLTTVTNTTTTTVPPTTLTTTTTVNVHGPKNLAAFAFTFSGLGTCVAKVSLGATGLVSGWCGHSWGTGTTDNGHRFAWVSAASLLILTGELVGVVNAIPDALGGQSCTTGALKFIVTGAVALHHCAVFKNKLDTLVNTTTQTLTTQNIPPSGPTVHTLNTHVTTNGAYHLWIKVCI